MYDFTEYLMIEKVSNKEIKSVLRDPNIMVGIEFEIILDDLGDIDSSNRDTGYGTPSELDDELNDYKSEIRDYYYEIKQVNDDWEEYIVDESDQYQAEMADEILDFEKEKEKYKGLLDNFATTNHDEIEDKISSIDEDILALEETIQELESMGVRRDYQEMFELMEEVSRSVDDRYDYISDNLSRPPEPSRNLDMFFEDLIGTDITSTAIDWIEFMSDINYYSASDAVSAVDVYQPSAYMEDYYEDQETGPEALNEYPYWDDLPFTNYEISDYHGGSAHSTNWRIEPDSSLPEGGVEIISPKMPLQEMLKMLPKMFAFVQKHGGTNRATGMHVNMSYKGKDFSTDADMLKLMLFVDEGYIWKKFPERVGSTYTPSVLSKIIENIKHNKETISDDFKKMEKKTLELFKKNIRGPDQKFFGVNTSNAGGEKGRIEFRYLGGSNYHKKLKEITSAIGRFGFYMSIALDERARKKEYILKLNRLHNKFAKAEKPKLSDKDIQKIMKNGKLVKKIGNPAMQTYIYKRKKYRLDIVGSTHQMVEI